MPATDPKVTRRWTAAELHQVPPEERDAILRAAAESAASEYRDNCDLTAFEAFDQKDLHASLFGKVVES